MKFQDILFFVVFAALLYKHNPRYFAIAGLLCILVSIPLFAFWIFFTAQHVVWYAGGFFLMSTLLLLWEHIHENRH